MAFDCLYPWKKPSCRGGNSISLATGHRTAVGHRHESETDSITQNTIPHPCCSPPPPLDNRQHRELFFNLILQTLAPCVAMLLITCKRINSTAVCTAVCTLIKLKLKQTLSQQNPKLKEPSCTTINPKFRNYIQCTI